MTTFVDRVVLNPRRYTEEFGIPQLAGLDEGIAKTFAEVERAADE